MGCAGCVRVILIVFNLIFFLIGGASLGLGIWVITDQTSLIKYLTSLSTIVQAYNIPSLLTSAAYIFLVAGGIIFVIAFLGCCGAWKKIKCLLVIYVVVIGLIILMEVAVIVVAYFFSDKVDTYLQGFMLSALQTKYNSSLTPLANGGYTYGYADEATLAIDVLQMQFNCCGVINGSDYSNATGWKKVLPGTAATLLVPASCCQMSGASDFITLIKSAASGNLTLTNSSCPLTGYASNMKSGCYSAIKDVIKANSTLVMAIGAAVLGIELLLIIFACCVCKSIDNEKQVGV